MHELETLVALAASYIQLVLEVASVLTVAVGGVVFVVVLLSQRLRDSEPRARLIFGRYLIVALEFQLGADIIATATDPTLQEIGKLTAIAVIRTFLDYFLVREMRKEGSEE